MVLLVLFFVLVEDVLLTHSFCSHPSAPLEVTMVLLDIVYFLAMLTILKWHLMIKSLDNPFWFMTYPVGIFR